METDTLPFIELISDMDRQALVSAESQSNAKYIIPPSVNGTYGTYSNVRLLIMQVSYPGAIWLNQGKTSSNAGLMDFCWQQQEDPTTERQCSLCLILKGNPEVLFSMTYALLLGQITDGLFHYYCYLVGLLFLGLAEALKPGFELLQFCFSLEFYMFKYIGPATYMFITKLIK